MVFRRVFRSVPTRNFHGPPDFITVLNLPLPVTPRILAIAAGEFVGAFNDKPATHNGGFAPTMFNIGQFLKFGYFYNHARMAG